MVDTIPDAVQENILFIHELTPEGSHRAVRVRQNSYPARNFRSVPVPVPGPAGTGTGTVSGTRTRTRVPVPGQFRNGMFDMVFFSG